MAKTPRLDQNYFRLRDFEYAQPLYDLAYLLEVTSISEEKEVPKYRTFSLWRAAYGFDGYTNIVDRWLDNQVEDDQLDYVPSDRIKNYLYTIRETGSLPELHSLSTIASQRALRLRSIRNLGLAHIARSLSEGERASAEWLNTAVSNTGVSRDELTAAFQGTYGTWQAAHVIPPLARFLNEFRQIADEFPQCEFDQEIDGINPISDFITVIIEIGTTIDDQVAKALKNQRLFRIKSREQNCIYIEHQLGWWFKLKFGNLKNPVRLHEWLKTVDPFVQMGTKLKSDLHLHTSWSDGNAGLGTMAKAAQANGLEYFAVTDHSRSCKLQDGLNPIAWVRQAASLSLNKVTCPILHGIEVDILSDGNLDLPAGLLSGMDLVVASVHSNWTADEATNTQRLIKAIESGLIDVIGHPTSAVIGKPGSPDYVRPSAKVNWHQVFELCAKWKVALEFNCFPSRLDLSREMLSKALDAGCWISIGSDAHSRSHLSHLKFGSAVLKKLRTTRVLNYLTYDEIREWLANARKARSQLNKTVFVHTQIDLFADATASGGDGKVDVYLNPPQRIPNGSKIVGFDLTAGKNKATGVAVLDGMTVETCSLMTDEELINFVKTTNPAIVSIDSPLGFPGGGSEINPSAGIVRVAEHDLASVGIPAYPALIDSMKELTIRGIRLRKALESIKPPFRVIESYPGAAQDILCIPRKQKSLGLLREGLSELGITGKGLSTKSHDEMDAITSAIVGRFYESGDFQPMGIKSEAQLIVPTISPLRFQAPPIVCLAGKTGVGRSVVARYLALFYGFRWIKTRDLVRELLLEELAKKPRDRIYRTSSIAENITEWDLRDFGLLLLQQFKHEPLKKRLRQIISDTKVPIVIDSIRDSGDIDKFGFLPRPVYTWFLDSSDAIILSRLLGRNKNALRGELQPINEIDQRIHRIRDMADALILNNEGLEDLRWQVDDMLFSFLALCKEPTFACK